jgi:HSP20 family molecular chaperone IbpA
MSSTSLEKQKPQALVQRSEPAVEPARPVTVPHGDIYETSDNVVLVLDMPGVEKDGVEVTLAQDVLTVFGRSTLPSPDGFNLTYREYVPTSFRREFRLSAEVDRERIAAQVKDGVLTLTLPKAAQAKPHKIVVSQA